MVRQMVKNKKGLTLVELLAVIVVLGIVAAIAVPAIGGVIEKSRKNADIATLQLIQDAAIRYVTTENITSVTAAEGNIASILVGEGYLANFRAELQADNDIEFDRFAVSFASGEYTVTVSDAAGTAIDETRINGL